MKENGFNLNEKSLYVRGKPLQSMFSLTYLVSLVVIFSGFWAQGSAISPSIKGMTNLRRELVEGEDLLLTCLVRNIGTHTVSWRRHIDGKKKVLTYDKLRVLDDDRISILHDQAPNHNTSLIKPGGEVWVLSIKNVTVMDSGGYLCKVNSDPPAQTSYMVRVKQQSEGHSPQVSLRSTHNYTSCCLDNNVDSKCLGFCNLHDILEGKTGIEPEKCETEFPSIVQCMASFRDHTPCCEKQGIPDICQDLCRGEYTVQDDYVKSHFSCTTFTEATLLCISEGIEILPMPPQSPSVSVLDPYSLMVEWVLPDPSSPPYDHFIVNVTTLRRFDIPTDTSYDTTVYDNIQDFDAEDDLHFVVPKKMQIKVPANVTSFKVENLSSLTWYEVSVISVNSHGTSMSPYSIKALTHPVGLNKTDHLDPEMPDIVGCCISKGIKHDRCLQTLCNPTKRYIDEPDMIVCAAWAQETFSCLTGNIDHSDCCRERGLPDICIELCTGNVSRIDYNYFRCVDYFSDYRSCLLQGYGVLPSPPVEVQVSNINPTFALLSWGPPEENANSVSSYHAYYRPLNTNRDCLDRSFPSSSGLIYLGVHVKSSPQVLENLCEDTEYEVYVEAFNTHGTSSPSERILFRTPKQRESTDLANLYNATECCAAVNLSPGCLPLCGYNVRMSHFRALSNTCTPEMSKVFRCIVGGRDHSKCCARRGVPVSCLSLCTGSFRGEDRTPSGCLPYLGNIMMCLEEGVEVLPGPVTSLHATQIGGGAVTLQWDPPENSKNVTHYQVHYQSVDKFSATHAVFKLNNTLNVSQPLAVLTDLKKGSLYNFFVISVNEWGTSLPSSILTLNTTEFQWNSTVIAGVPSAPHSLLLEGKSATSLTILWQPPIVSLPTDRIRYTLHYGTITSKEEDPEFNSTVTSSTAMRLESLTPNTQYIIFVTATNDLGESRPSETLLAWTDPAYPAFVETPTVHPNNLIVEGGSMTVLCIAMGSPPPKVSLFISGILVHQDVTRHMVTIVRNVTRSMSEISCYADNGYGTPMQSSVSITVSHRPTITANEKVKVIEGNEVTLKCLVSAWPEPSMIWWKNVEKRLPVIHGGNISLGIQNVSKGNYMMSLKMKHATDSEFYCHASNALGSYTHTVKVSTWEEVRQPLNVSDCCIASNVSNQCLSACDFDQIDFHKQMNNDDCIADFGKLLYCGADMSDHRGCCSKKGVPDQCLDWCRSKPLAQRHHYEKCLLQYAPPIFDCFLEGQDSLPGPPDNVRFTSLSPTVAEISWEIPSKNPDKVEMYRVFWRARGTRMAMKNDTSTTSLRVFNLTEGTSYEVAVKAGNRLGTSILTQTKVFTHSLPYVYLRSTTGSSPAGIAIGACIGIIVVLFLAGFGWWMARRKIFFSKHANGISFENPSYIREQSGDAVQIAETPNGSLNGAIPNNMNIPLTNGGVSNGITGNGTPGENPNGNIWNTQTASTNAPGFEKDINSKGGYKRFKS